MTLIRINGQLQPLSTNNAMKLLLDQSKREKVAALIVSSNGRQRYSREEIRVRIQKILKRIGIRLLESNAGK